MCLHLVDGLVLLLCSGDRFKRRTFTFGFGTGNEATDVRLKADFDTVLVWRKENEGDSTSWHEIDLNDVKIIEAKGEAHSMFTTFNSSSDPVSLSRSFRT